MTPLSVPGERFPPTIYAASLLLMLYLIMLSCLLVRLALHMPIVFYQNGSAYHYLVCCALRGLSYRVMRTLCAQRVAVTSESSSSLAHHPCPATSTSPCRGLTFATLYTHTRVYIARTIESVPLHISLISLHHHDACQKRPAGPHVPLEEEERLSVWHVYTPKEAAAALDQQCGYLAADVAAGVAANVSTCVTGEVIPVPEWAVPGMDALQWHYG
jgi:hypothetical protein